MAEAEQVSTRHSRFRRKLCVLVSMLALGSLLVTGGTWLVNSMGYVSTDDARVNANVVTISPETPGRVVVLAKDEGDLVRPGEVMARLDAQEAEGQIRQARAELESARSRWLEAQTEINLYLERHKEEIAKAEAALRRYRHDLENARAHERMSREDWQRIRKLYERDLISKQEEAHAETEFRRAKARVAALEEQVKEGEAALRLVRVPSKQIDVKEAVLKTRQAEVQRAKEYLANLKRKLELMTIRSPVRGRVAKREAMRGEFVEPGQPIFMVVDTSEYWIEANVEETKIRFVKPGAKAIIRVDSYPGHDFSGRVLEVGEATVSAFSLFSPAKLTGELSGFVPRSRRLLSCDVSCVRSISPDANTSSMNQNICLAALF